MARRLRQRRGALLRFRYFLPSARVLFIFFFFIPLDHCFSSFVSVARCRDTDVLAGMFMAGLLCLARFVTESLLGTRPRRADKKNSGSGLAQPAMR